MSSSYFGQFNLCVLLYHPIYWEFIVTNIVKVTFHSLEKNSSYRSVRSCAKCWLMLSISAQSTSGFTPNWHSISTSTLDWQSVCWPSVEWLLCISQHSMACLEKLPLLDFWPTVDWEVNRVSTKCRSNLDYRSRVNLGYWFRVSISTWLWMPFVQMILITSRVLPSNLDLTEMQKLHALLSELSCFLIIIFSAHQICWPSRLCSLWNKEQ